MTTQTPGNLQRSTPVSLASDELPTSTEFVPRLSEEEAQKQARLLKAFADPTRLRILSLLSRHPGKVRVFEIVESFVLEQPTISHHLRILRDAGLIDCRKKGLWAYYYVHQEVITQAEKMIQALHSSDTESVQ